MREHHDHHDWGPPRPVPTVIRVLVPVLFAIFQVGGSFGASHSQPDVRAIDALGFALVLIGPVAMLLHHWWPRPALVAAGVSVAIWITLGYPYGPIFAAYAVLTVIAVVRGDRLLAWAVAGLVLLGQLLRSVVSPDSSWTWAGTGGLLAWMIVALALAEVARGRKERVATARLARQESRARREGEERLLIAQELHDVVAHHMSLINVQAGVALHLADRRPENVEPALRAIRDASSEGLAELRSLVDVLRADHAAAPRTPTVRLAALDDLVERSRVAGLDVSVERTGAQGELSAAVDLAAYRIVQEAITNVVRHAGARRAAVRLVREGGTLTVSIEDDGTGDPDAVHEGNGLSGMRERARALGGSVEVGRSPMGGLLVMASMPAREGSSS